MNPGKYYVILSFSVMATIGVIGTPGAEENGEEPPPEMNPDITIMNIELWSSSTTSSTTTMAAGLGLLSMQLAAARDAQVETYMRQNAVAIQQDLHFGAGATARDLAALLHVDEDHLQAFSGLLYEQRGQLSPLAEPGGVDATSARAFMAIIIEEMLHHEELSEPGRRLAEARQDRNPW